ncbi:MAG TPA: GNAT family protein [Niastella sp.]|nr:GNAT family protein [Niastella sp.]
MEQQVEITGRHGIVLRSLTPANATALAAIANDASIAAFVRDIFPHPYTIFHAQEFIQITAKDTHLQSWGIFENDILAGVISLTLQEDIYRHAAEIGFWLGADFRKRGIITEAIALACQFTFSQLPVVRIFAHVFSHNEASKKALLKNGFEIEGIRKKGAIKNRELIDDFLMAKIKY